MGKGFTPFLSFLLMVYFFSQTSITCVLRVYFQCCLDGLEFKNATAEQEVLGSLPGLDKVLLGFSTRNFLVAVTESGVRLMAIGSSLIQGT